MSVRVRFAPSPTGMLHVGGVRTAIYNWLFARRHGGTFILRIDDTDVEREKKDAVNVILEGLRWCGLQWDEGPIYQSSRMDRYKAAADRLVASGRAYWAKDSEALKRWREAREMRGLKGGGAEPADRTAEGAGSALFFKVFPGEPEDSSFEDVVKGKMSKAALDILPEFVIVRAGGAPVYNFTTVVDDIELGITHVIRGDDHVENTHKHIALFKALGAAPPAFAHLPMIHNDKGEKLSKRRDPVAVTQFEEMGLLPEAFANFLALLGWSPGENVEVMPLAEMAKVFDLSRVKSAAARFDLKKLHWMSGQYIKALPLPELASRLVAFMARERVSLLEDLVPRLEAVVRLFQPRLSTLLDFYHKRAPSPGEPYPPPPPQGRMFCEETPAPDATAAAALSKPGIRESLAPAAALFESADALAHDALEPKLRALADERKVKFKDLMQGVRAALTGGTVSPPLFDMIAILGRERTVRRLRAAAGA